MATTKTTTPKINFNMVAKAPTPVAKTPTQVPIKIVSNPSGATPNPLGNKVATNTFKTTNAGSGGLQQKAAAQAVSSMGKTVPPAPADTTGQAGKGYWSTTGWVAGQTDPNAPKTQNSGSNTGSSTNTQNTNQNAPQGNNTPNKGTTAPSTDITQAGLIQQLMQLQQGLYPKAEKTASQISKLKQDLAKQLGNTYQNPIPLEFQTGRAGVLQNMAAQKEQALQGQLSNQIGIANAGAGMLNSAIGATAPTSNIILRNPQTGEPIGNQNLGNMAYQQGQIQEKGNLGAKNIQDSADLASGQNQVKGLNNFIQGNGVNPTDFVKVNDLINRISQQVGSPNYQKLQNYLAGINSSYSKILGNNVDVAAIAKQSGKGIASIIQELDQQAQGNIAGGSSVGTGQPNTYQTPGAGSDIYNF